MLKKIFIILMALLLLGGITFLILDEPIPTGEKGPKAELLADKMLKTVGKEAWEKVAAIEWTFPGNYHYVWDKKNDLVEVKWEDYRVLVDTQTRAGLAFKGQKQMEGSNAKETVEHGLARFFNDSFWLAAPFKVRDPSTERFIVESGESPSLLVKYNNGGVTPGDAYLWHLDESGLPLSWQMWVNIIPIGGLSASWEGWITDPDGFKVSTRHESIIGFSVTDIIYHKNSRPEVFQELEIYSPELPGQ